MKLILRIIGLAGLILFSTAFVFSYSTPGFVEDIGKKFIKDKIEEKTNEKIQSLSLNTKDSALARLASGIIKQNAAKIEKLKQQLKSKLHEKIATVVAQMRDLDCECRRKYAEKLKNNTEFSIFSLQNANRKLLDFMKTRYMEVVVKLKKDFRIFTGSNALIFALLLLVSFMKPAAMTHLYLPGLLLFAATLICSFFYIFEQNWFFTIIYDNYLGWGYLTYLGVVFGFLCDIALNRARITTEIINTILNAIGNAASVVPLPC